MKRIAIAIIFVLAEAHVLLAETSSVAWIRQFGTNSIDNAFGASGDLLGNIYVSGSTGGSLGGTNAGDGDAFVRSFDSAGNLRWTKQRGTSGLDTYYGVSADSTGIYLTGITEGSFGGPNAGGYDSFLTKYDVTGAFQWASQFGTSQNDFTFGVSTDGSGNAYISGETSGGLSGPLAGGADAVILKYNSSSNNDWVRQFGTNGTERAQSIVYDRLGSVYVTGGTDGTLGQSSAGGTDAFIAKYNTSGAQQWIRQLGTNRNEVGRGVASDAAGNVYIVGYGEGGFGGISAAGTDCFVAKYDPQGSLIWTQGFGTSVNDDAESVAVDNVGNVYVYGDTSGRLGATSFGGRDAFLAKFNTNGDMMWVNQFGTISDEYAASTGGIYVNLLGDVYVTGTTLGNFGGTSAGSWDAFVVKFQSVPEPSSVRLGAFAIMVWNGKRKRYPITSNPAFVFR
jgi:hypothetical protein